MKNCCVQEHHQAVKKKRYWSSQKALFWRITEDDTEQSISERYPWHREPCVSPRSRLKEEKRLHTAAVAHTAHSRGFWLQVGEKRWEWLREKAEGSVTEQGSSGTRGWSRKEQPEEAAVVGGHWLKPMWSHMSQVFAEGSGKSEKQDLGTLLGNYLTTVPISLP